MPSDNAKQIIQQVFGDEKAAALDSINDALGAATYDAIQARKDEFAKAMGFELADTAQKSTDEVDKVLDAAVAADIQDVDTSGVRLPSDPDPNDPPAAEAETPTEEPETTEEPKDETDS